MSIAVDYVIIKEIKNTNGCDRQCKWLKAYTHNNSCPLECKGGILYMSVIRVKKNRDFVAINCYHLRDRNLSLKGRGLLDTVLSLPDNWDYSINGLCTILKEGRTTVLTALKELQDLGYCEVKKIYPQKDKNKYIDYEYTFSETPMKSQEGVNDALVRTNNQVNKGLQEGYNQGVDSLGVDSLGVDNRPQYSIKELNTNEPSTKEYKDIISGKPDYTADVHTIIDYLNNKTQQSYRYSESSMRHIRARLAEKFTVADCKKVIDTKTEEWGKDDKMKKYLRPETLFGGKFENYLNQKAEGEEVIDEEQMYWRNKMKEKGHLRIEKGDD